jgi:multiple sugar transport system permease protein
MPDPRETRSRFRLPTGWLFISPWLLGLLLLFAYPFVASLYWSFCRYDLLSPPEWIGTEHYRRIATELWQGDGFGKALWNTLYYASLSVPLSIITAVLLAIMLSWRIRGQAIFRTLFFLPSIIPLVASSILWLWLLDPQSGLVNHLLGWLHIPPQLWFQGVQQAAHPATFLEFGSKDALVLMSVWGVGNFMLIYLAALGDIPPQLYEAAALDGAGRVRQFWHITLPMLSPLILFNLMLGLIKSFQAFTQVYLVSEGTGQPVGSTLLLSLHLFLAAFQDLEMGYTSAMAWLLFVVLAVATALLLRSSRHWVHYRTSLGG